jgi:hypothetical protein
MDENADPYSPGAGWPPHELAGRGTIIAAATTAIERAKNGRSTKNHLLTGLRGVGKTVLLVEFEKLSEELKCYPTAVIEADHNSSLPKILLPQLFRIINRLDKIKKAEHDLRNAMNLLRSVASTFNVKFGAFDISVSKNDVTGDLGADLSDVFFEIGAAAKKNRHQ